MRFTGLRAALAAAVTLAGVALTVPAASAATTGGHGHALRPQVFTLVISTKTPDGVVNAYGPIRGRNGTDVTVSDNVDIFKFARGTVTIYHQPTTNNQVRGRGSLPKGAAIFWPRRSLRILRVQRPGFMDRRPPRAVGAWRARTSPDDGSGCPWRRTGEACRDRRRAR